MGVIGLLFGIVSLVTCWLGWVPIYGLIPVGLIPVTLGFFGIIFSVIGKSLAEKNHKSTGVATTGLVLSIIGMIISGIGFSICVVCAGSAARALDSFGSYL